MLIFRTDTPRTVNTTLFAAESTKYLKKKALRGSGLTIWFTDIELTIFYYIASSNNKCLPLSLFPKLEKDFKDFAEEYGKEKQLPEAKECNLRLVDPGRYRKDRYKILNY